MAKKFGKFLAVTAVLSGLVVGGIAIYKKFIDNNEDDDFDYEDDDYDEDEDYDEETTSKREYVPITIEAPEKGDTAKEEFSKEETVEDDKNPAEDDKEEK